MRQRTEITKPYRVRLDGHLYEILHDRECTVYRVEANQRRKVLDYETINAAHTVMAKREGGSTFMKVLRMIWGGLKRPWL